MRILVADDHPLFVEALQALIERSVVTTTLTVVGDFDAAHRALAEAGGYDLAILDLRMPGAQGLDGVERTLARFPETPLLVISGCATAAEVSQLVRLGARGFLPKSLPSKALAAALQVVLSGGTYLPAEYEAPAPPTDVDNPGIRLTPRESEVLTLLTTGRSNKEIGRSLALQEVTVKLHVRSIFRKLGVRNRVEAANSAMRFKFGGAARP